MEHRVSRRDAIRRGVATAILTGAAGLVGCARAAVPAVQQPKIILGMRAWGVGSGASGSPATINSLLYQNTEPWRAKHPGVDIRIIDNTGGPQSVITSIIGGTGPDIYHSWHPGIMFAVDGFAADLRPYIKQYNADLSVFNRAQMDVFILSDGSIRALPYYLGINTLAVCEGMLDALGLTYPAPDWTYQDYATLAAAVARGGSKVGNQPVYGGNYGLGPPTGHLPPDCVMQGFGGSYVEQSNLAKCNLGSEGSIRATTWAYGLAKADIITHPGASATFGATLAMTMAPSFFLPQAATNWRSLKWRYYNMPAFPVGGTVSQATEDFWALNPESPHLDLAWDLLHWCAFEPSWQVSQMKMFLLSPALMSLWDQWLTYVPQLAPIFTDKNLAAFANLAKNNNAYPVQFFRYNDPAAESMVNAMAVNMWGGQIGIRLGLTQLAQQIDAMQTTAAQTAPVTLSTLRQEQQVLKAGLGHMFGAAG